ncbi:uncharacterized protein N7511_005729 [Penicillium nucicola]|uniref:uncharacterized protein n=1 Tax=Penicillium nucicola TaxID=1850975 RepID=UPI00254552C2|nr:uncharacterized protein N7511_005729 [Penicillium nucicola]KAJ5762347.1 hypothetical protein N7511_005729 [Penicillium nucicola]
MSAPESSTSQSFEKKDPHDNEDVETVVAATPTDPSAQAQEESLNPDNNQPGDMGPEEANEPLGSVSTSKSAPKPLTTAPQPSSLLDQEPPAGQMESLSISGQTMSDQSPSSKAPLPPTPPEKDDVYLNSTGTGPTRTLPPIDTSSASPEKELPDVPSQNEKETNQTGQGEETREDNDSQPEIQNIMGQFQDPARSTDQEEIMSPRLELADQFRGPNYFPPRKSSLDPAPQPESAASPIGTSPESQILPKVSHKSVAHDESMSTRRSSTSTVPPMPEPESDQPFDFHRFLEQLRHRTADPVAKFLRSFLMEFGKKQWMVHEQVKIISDFLTFITNKMAVCEIWRDVSDSEFDNAKEGMEKLVMNRLYSQTFAPAIPAPPTIPRSASRSRRRELERLHGPWRRGQHQEDIERDDILAQKIRIYSWVSEAHLDIPPVSGGGRRFLTLAQQEISKINGYRAPRDKVICILNCCKVIFGLLKNTKKADTSADSFIPLLIYVVLHANPDHLVSNIQYILRFRNQDKLGGEAGYYLSSLSGAIQFIETLDRTSLTVSDEEFETKVEAAVSAMAEQNRESETLQKRTSTSPSPQPQASSSRKEASQSSDDETSAPVAGLLRTIQKPLSTIGRIFSDEGDAGSSTQDRPQPVPTPQPGVAPPRLTPNIYQPPRASSEEGRRSGDERSGPIRHGSGASAKKNLTRVLDAQDAAARQASAEDAEARRIQRKEHKNVVETLSNMFPNLDKDVIDDVVKIKQGRVGLAVDACLALSAE